MPNLRTLPLDITYRSDDGPLLERFYVPCMQQSVLYRRAVGYFTSNGLEQATRGIIHLVRNGGRIELVCSPHLTEEDLAALRKGYAAREVIVYHAAQRALSGLEACLPKDRLEALAWLVANGKLDVKLAVRLGADGQPCRGIYHEKFGLFEDDQGHRVAFSGSANETAGGLLDNFEAVDVYWSWDDPHGRVARKAQDFERLWQGQTPGLDLVSFTEATRTLLEPYLPTPAPPPTLWRHQDEAIQRFLEAERGVLEMATGTGKTRTALRIAQTLFEQQHIHTLLVAADGNDLLDQWYGELIRLTPNLRIGGASPAVLRHYERHRETDRFVLRRGGKVMLCSRPNLPAILRALSRDDAAHTLLVHDEVHRLGSPANRQHLAGLADPVRFRLGLSATPEREYDAEGTAFIAEHIGPVLFSFGLDDAIRQGILAPFHYDPLAYEPGEDDRRRIHQVYKQQAARQHHGNPMAKEELWTALALVHKTSRAKLPVFRQFIRERPELLERCLIFVATMEYGDAVLDIVHEHRHDFHTYFSGDDRDLLRQFAEGRIECLVTCHRLSEGIDIRSLRSVILFASDRTRLETIQRIGRCLRTDPDDPDKRAHVVDFIRTGAAPNADAERRDFLRALSRIEPEPH